MIEVSREHYDFKLFNIRYFKRTFVGTPPYEIGEFSFLPFNKLKIKSYRKYSGKLHYELGNIELFFVSLCLSLLRNYFLGAKLLLKFAH